MSMWKMTWTTALATAAAALMMTTTVGAQVGGPDPFVDPEDITVDLDSRTISPSDTTTVPSGTPLRFPADTLVPDRIIRGSETVRPAQGIDPDAVPGINPDAEPIIRPDAAADNAVRNVDEIRVDATQPFIRPDGARVIDPDQRRVGVRGSRTIDPDTQDGLAIDDEARWLDPTESGYFDLERRQINPDQRSPIAQNPIVDPQTRRDALRELAIDVETARRLTDRLQTTGRVFRGEFVGVDELSAGSVQQANSLVRDLNALGLRLGELERGFRATGFDDQAQQAARMRADVTGLQNQFGGAVLDVNQWDIGAVDAFNQAMSNISRGQANFPNPDPFGLLR